jgi:hypothetical protein
MVRFKLVGLKRQPTRVIGCANALEIMINLILALSFISHELELKQYFNFPNAGFRRLANALAGTSNFLITSRRRKEYN